MILLAILSLGKKMGETDGLQTDALRLPLDAAIIIAYMEQWQHKPEHDMSIG